MTNTYGSRNQLKFNDFYDHCIFCLDEKKAW